MIRIVQDFASFITISFRTSQVFIQHFITGWFDNACSAFFLRARKQLEDAHMRLLKKYLMQSKFPKQAADSWRARIDFDSGEGSFVRVNGVDGSESVCGDASEVVKLVRGAASRKRPRQNTEARRLSKKEDDSFFEGEAVELGPVEEPDPVSLALSKKLAAEQDDGRCGAGKLAVGWVRRSVRASGQTELSSRTVNELLELIKGNQPEVQVLKLKDHYLGPQTNTTVIESVLWALMKNDNCQALYIQNFNEGMRDPQLALLAKVLQRGKIWALNIGENYNVSPRGWDHFAQSLVLTNVTHMYASEHVISAELKTTFRDIIRANRAKHRLHDSIGNLAVIQRVTNMWWNPHQGRRIADAVRAKQAAATHTPTPLPPAQYRLNTPKAAPPPADEHQTCDEAAPPSADSQSPCGEGEGVVTSAGPEGGDGRPLATADSGGGLLLQTGETPKMTFSPCQASHGLEASPDATPSLHGQHIRPGFMLPRFAAS
mmetsp:Transcript_60505/g.136748  ORF Transcript_60505/g.136748 Transcript_60505/m.136748 type:complete len:487 (+) Transcript_60505:361-1821(+)